MARTRSSTDVEQTSRPFLTPEGNQSYLVNLANTLVEKRLRDGSASSQETVHFLKIGSRETQLKIEQLEEENKLLRAKTEALKSQQNVEKLYEDALNAMRRYSGQTEIVYDEYDE